jgi:outer membrane protein TolC
MTEIKEEKRPISRRSAACGAIAIIVALGTPLFCQEPMLLTLEDALGLAKRANASLILEGLTTRAAERRASRWWNLFVPSASLGVSARNVHSLGGNDGPAQSGTSVTATAGLQLSLGPSARETILQTSLTRDAALLSLAERERFVAREVKKSYYALLADREALSLAEVDLELAARQAELVKKNYDSGLASELSLLEATYAAAAIEPKIQEGRRAYRSALRSFAILLGLEPSASLELAGSLAALANPAPATGDLSSLVEAAPSVRVASLELKRAESVFRAARLQRYGPTISASEAVSTQDLDEGLSPPRNGTFSLSVTIPLNGYLPFSKETLSSLDAADSVARAAEELSLARKESHARILALSESLEGFSQGMELAAMNERLATRAYELSGQGYRSGLVTQTDLDSARQRLLESRLASLTAALRYETGLIDLAHELGVSERDLCAKEPSDE